MNGSAVRYWLVFAALVAMVYAGFKAYQVQQSQTQGTITVANNLPPLEDFELTERSGKPFRSADMQGRVWVASFFFSTCPGSCTRLNSNIKYLNALDDIRDATWVSITVDPVTDTLPVLREYADRFNADPQRWLFCRGEFGYVKRLADEFLKVGGVSYKSHNDYAVVVDKHGQVAGMFKGSSTKESEQGVELIKKCLAAEYTPPKSSDAARPVVKNGTQPSGVTKTPSAEAA